MEDTELLTRVRTNMMIDQPFLGQLAVSLDLKFDDSMETAYTDGVSIGVNEKFFAGLQHKERTGIIAHEVFHVMLLHHIRKREWMPARTYQVAIDIVVNGMCLENRFTLPKDGILPENWEGGIDEYFKLSHKPVEEVVRILMDKYPQEEELPDPTKTGTGECKDFPKEGKGDGQEGEGEDKKGQPRTTSEILKREEQRVKTMIAQAYQNTKRHGDLPASLDRTVREILHPKIKWIRRIVQEIAAHSKSKHVWPPFNRRFIHQGLYLHSMKGETIGNVVWATDTSGSVDQPTLDEMNAEFAGLARTYDGEFTCLSVDSAVQKVEQFNSQNFPKRIEWKGGGGTNYRPAFNWVRDNMKKRVNVMVYATDGHCWRFPSEKPSYPVFWVLWDHIQFNPPFGEVLYVD